MTLSEFRLRYQLQPLATPIVSAPADKPLRKAAVLIAITQSHDGVRLILTRRPEHMRAHPGQISFPGGKVETTDIDETATALREAEEEIGLRIPNVEVLGQLPAHKTITGFEITPVIGLVRQAFTPVLDPGEVADYFTVPLAFLRQQTNRHRLSYSRNGKQYPLYVIPYREKFIWGATAAMIDLLCRQLYCQG